MIKIYESNNDKIKKIIFDSENFNVSVLNPEINSNTIISGIIEDGSESDIEWQLSEQGVDNYEEIQDIMNDSKVPGGYDLLVLFPDGVEIYDDNPIIENGIMYVSD